MKKFFGGALTLIALALVIIAVSFVRFDIPREELAKKYANGASQFLMLPDGATAHVRDEGNRDGPALVLVHGSNASLHTWEPWVERLGDRFRIVTLDMPGHGLTGAVPSGDYSRAGMVAFTHEVVEMLGLTKFALGGNSMGGGVAALYAETYPDELTALILVDAAGIPREQVNKDGMPLAFRLARMPVLNKIMLYVTPRSVVAEGLHKAFHDQSQVTPEMVSRYYDLALMEGNRKATVARFANSDYTDSTVADGLSALKMPVLIMWGDQDRLIPVEMASEFADRIPQAQTVIYQDVGHIPMEEAAEASAADLRGFLESALAVQDMGESRASQPDEPQAGAVTVPALAGKGEVEVMQGSPMDAPAEAVAP
ncbi:MAG: alpha/beta fold hydrolase [Rhizobiales bacterium]|nr:alpha/beta fold hydrolase [Hyphomicrobiales bacterium]